MRKKIVSHGILGTDDRHNAVEIVKFYGGDAACQRAERDALTWLTGEVVTIDEVTWPYKPDWPTVPGTTIPVTHVLIAEAEPSEEELRGAAMTHTPTPWDYDFTRKHYEKPCIRHNGMIVCTFPGQPINPVDDERKANAAYIVTAVNAHEKLIAEKAALVEALGNMLNYASDKDIKDGWHYQRIAATQKARKLLASIWIAIP